MTILYVVLSSFADSEEPTINTLFASSEPLAKIVERVHTHIANEYSEDADIECNDEVNPTQWMVEDPDLEYPEYFYIQKVDTVY